MPFPYSFPLTFGSGESMPYNLLGPRGRRLLEALNSSPGLVYLAPLNEQSGAIADWSPNRNTGTVSGNPTYSTQIAGHCYGLNFDGTGDYVTLGDVAALDFERTDECSAIALIDPNISANGSILSKWDSAAGRGWSWQIESGRAPQLVLQNTATTDLLAVQANAALTNGVDVLLGFSYTGSSAASGVTLYRNGAADADTDLVDTLSATIQHSSAAHIGALAGAGLLFNGHIGMLAAWSRALRAEEHKLFAYLCGLA